LPTKSRTLVTVETVGEADLASKVVGAYAIHRNVRRAGQRIPE